MSPKSYSFSEETNNQLTTLAEKLGYVKGKKAPEKQLLEDILEGILSNQEFILEGSDIKELVAKGIKTTTNLKARSSDKERSQKAIEKIQNAIKECKETGVKPTKTRLNKVYGCFYDALVNYEKNNPGCFD